MKQLLIFTLLFFSAVHAVTAQQGTPGCLSGDPANPPAPPSFGCTGIDFYQNYSLWPELKVRVNTHWYARPDGSNLSPAEAMQLTQALVNMANNQLMNLPQNAELGNTGQLIPHVPQAKWQFQLYTNQQENPDDIYGGIFFHEHEVIDGITFVPDADDPNDNPYGPKTLNIHILHDPSYDLEGDGTPSTYAGYALPSGNAFVMFNVGYFLNDPDVLPGNAKVFNHETGHMFELPHAHNCDNPCGDVPGDLDPILECDEQEVECQMGLGANCDWSNGNNLMMSGTDNLAITPCQWSTAYAAAFNMRSYVYKETMCEVAPTPIVIESGQFVVWNNVQLVSSNVQVKSGAQLTIECAAYFASEVGITVEKGGKLVVNGGYLTNMCPGEKWRGIDVWGNPAWAQPGISGPLDPDKAGVALFINNARVEMAEYGVYAGYLQKSNHPGLPEPHLNGGLVVVESSSLFSKNTHGVYLPYYKPEFGAPLQNQSRFSNSDFFRNATGIVVGGTDGVEISHCDFGISADGTGLLTWDSEVLVENGCTFKYLNKGIEALATHPYSAQLLIDGATEANVFENNKVGVLISGMDKDAGLQCIKNLFQANGTGIAIEGSSNFRIHDNTFYLNQEAGIDMRHTGSNDYRTITCNDFQYGNCFDIYARGKNDNLIFDGNAFSSFGSAQTINFFLEGDQGHPGNVGSALLGQSIGAPLANCFSAFDANIVTAGNTIFFQYFPPQEALPCKTPRCDIDDSGCINNYFFQNFPIQGIPGACGLETPFELFTPVGENNINYQAPSRRYGYYLQRSQFSEAQQILNAQMSQLAGQDAFWQIQAINLSRLAQPSFTPNSEQTTLLNNIAAQADPTSAPFAKGMLRVLAQPSPDWIPSICVSAPPGAEGRMEKESAQVDENNVKLQPEPADEILEVQVSGDVEGEMFLYNVQGRICRKERIQEYTTLSTTELPGGLYILQLRLIGKSPQVFKILIQH